VGVGAAWVARHGFTREIVCLLSGSFVQPHRVGRYRSYFWASLVLCTRRDSGCCVLRLAGPCDASSLLEQTRLVVTKGSGDGDAGILALVLIGLWVLPFESLSFSLRESFERLSLGWPVGICWFDRDVVDLSFSLISLSFSYISCSDDTLRLPSDIPTLRR
jgi:hypothetical protein